MRNHIPALLAICLLLSGCEKEFRFANELSLFSSRVELPADAGETPVIVYANGAWTAGLEQNVPWAKLEQASGNGLGEVRFIYGDNADIARKATIVFKSGGTVKKVDMVQKSGFGDISFAFAYKSLTIARSGASGQLRFSTNLPEEHLDEVVVSVLDENGETALWLSNILVSGSSVSVDVAANAAGEPRTATLALSYTDAAGDVFTASLRLTQSAEGPYLSFDTDVIGEVYSAQPASVTLPFTTNLSPYLGQIASHASVSASWAKLTWPSDGSSVLVVDMEENGSSAQRSCTITLPFTDASGSTVNFTYLLKQAGASS